MNETIIKDFVKAIKAENKRPSAYDTTATVTRIDGDTAWVHIPGGVDETPVKRTIDAKKGDTVQVRVSGGTAYLIGNASAPPTDDTKANVADAKAMSAKKTANKADSKATAAKEAADRVAQYFWEDEEGAHVTVVPKDAFLEDPENGGGNTLIDADGMSVRDALKVLAMFGREQARIGSEDGGNIVIVPTGFNVNNAGIQLATFDIEDGIMFKTQQGADALSVAGEGEIVTRTIKDVISAKYLALRPRQILSQGTKSFDTVISSSYPTDKTLTVRTSNIYVSSGTYSNHTITYSEDDDTVVQIGSYAYSSNITIKAYIAWLTTGELVLREEIINSGSLVGYSDRSLFVDVSYVSYTKDVYIPKISTDGHLYLYGHSTPVGDLMTASTENYSETYSSGSSSWVYPEGNGDYSHHQAEGLLLPAGRWVIQACIRLQTLTDGAQYGVGVGYGDSRANATMTLASRQIVTAGSTSAVILNTTHLADASGSGRYYVGLYHGGKATVTYMSIKAMRVR